MTVVRNEGFGAGMAVVTLRCGGGRTFEAAGWVVEGWERLGLRRLGIVLAVT